MAPQVMLAHTNGKGGNIGYSNVCSRKRAPQVDLGGRFFKIAARMGWNTEEGLQEIGTSCKQKLSPLDKADLKVNSSEL